MSTESFPKTARLLNARDYKSVFDNSRYKVSSKEFLFLATASQGIRPRLGLVIAKKHINRAANRNRVKRLLREAFRTSQADLPLLDIVVLARKDADRLTPAELRAVIDRLLADLITRSNRDSKRNPQQRTRTVTP
jgi:ribonuclease P protein component